MDLMNLNRPLLMDGATGTQLQEMGMPSGTATALWAAEHPDAIRAVHESYLQAGSDFLIAATFGANRAALGSSGSPELVSSLNRCLVQIAKQTASGRAMVAGDISPTGWLCAPLGEHSFDELCSVYMEQVTALEEAGVDCYLIETQMSLADIRAAMLAVRQVSQKPILVSVTADEKGRLPYGSDMTACLITAQAMGAAVFGLNCSYGPDHMAENLLQLAPYAQIPLSCKANAGMPQHIDGRYVYNCPTQAYTDPVPALYRAGVRLFGGCCGSTPSHISALRAALDALPDQAFIPAERDYLASEHSIFPLPIGPLPVLNWDAAEDSLEPCAIRVDSDCLDELIEELPMLTGPLCLHSSDAAALETLLRFYQGRAAYAGGGLDETVLSALNRKYGLLIL